MSYSIRFEAKALKKASRKTAKVKLVIYKTSYDRVYKTLPYSVDVISWDVNRERLKSSSSMSAELNSLLDATQRMLEKQALLWENEGIDWSPKELRDTLDNKDSKSAQNKALSLPLVSYWVDYQINHFSTIERYKNGVVIVGSSNANNYQWLKNSLIEFTRSKYKKEFATYKFSDITDSFLQSYAVYIQQKGHKNGDKGGLSHKLKTLKATLNIASKKGIEGVNLKAFESVGNQMKQAKTTPKTISDSHLDLIKSYDRSKLSNKESFWLDLFLFSYYAGGMANVDVCHLNKSCLKDTHIEYTRHKCDKVASPALLPQMEAIIAKYSSQTYANYALPIFNKKQQTELQKRQKVDRITKKVNQTLKKICSDLGIAEKVTWYTARGTYITNMINAGVNSHEVADQAGNSVKIIEKHYYLVADRGAMLQKISSAI